MNGGMASSCHLWVLMGCRWSAAAPPGPGAGGAAPRCSRHSSGRRGDRLPARSPGPVREHRDRSREQCRCGGDQGDLDLDSRYWPISGTACPAVTLPVLAISAASSRRQTSTRPGNCTASACTATITGRLGWNTLSWCACLKRCREPHGPGGMCGCTSCAVPDRISRSVTGRCSRCWARTWIMPTWMPSDAATRSPAHSPAEGPAAPGIRRAHQRPGRPAAGHTLRTHLENIYERLHVSSRTAAVTRAFPDRAA
jgi:hypothetical protein